MLFYVLPASQLLISNSVDWIRIQFLEKGTQSRLPLGSRSLLSSKRKFGALVKAGSGFEGQGNDFGSGILFFQENNLCNIM